MQWQQVILIFAFTVCVCILLVDFFSYGKFLKQGIPHLAKCLALVGICLLQSCVHLLCFMVPQGPVLTYALMVTIVIGHLLNVFVVQLMLHIMGFNSPRARWGQRLLYLIPAMGAVAAATNSLHHAFLVDATKAPGAYGYALEIGWLGSVLSGLSVCALVVLFVLVFMIFLRRKEQNISPKVYLILMASMMVPSLAQWLEALLAGMTGADWQVSVFTVFVPVTVICYVYFGYLQTARNKAVGHTGEAYMVFDKWGNLVDRNRAAEKWFSEAGLEGKPTRGEFAEILGIGQEQSLHEHEFAMKRNGKTQYFMGNSFAISDGISQYCGDGFIISEITEYKRRMEQLNTLATRDALTGVYNRRYFDEYADLAITRSAEEKSPLTMLLVDLDHFKQVNDTYGHLAGDEVLTEVCAICTANLRKDDVLFRYGGEELVVLSERTDSNDGMRIAMRLVTAIEREPVRTNAGEVPITVSIGGCTYIAEAGDGISKWIDTADQSMYKAKQNGRNQVNYYR